MGSINAVNADLEEEFYEFNKEVSDLFIKEVHKEAVKDLDYQLLKNAVLGQEIIECSLSNWTCTKSIWTC